MRSKPNLNKIQKCKLFYRLKEAMDELLEFLDLGVSYEALIDERRRLRYEYIHPWLLKQRNLGFMWEEMAGFLNDNGVPRYRVGKVWNLNNVLHCYEYRELHKNAYAELQRATATDRGERIRRMPPLNEETY